MEHLPGIMQIRTALHFLVLVLFRGEELSTMGKAELHIWQVLFHAVQLVIPKQELVITEY